MLYSTSYSNVYIHIYQFFSFYCVSIPLSFLLTVSFYGMALFYGIMFILEIPEIVSTNSFERKVKLSILIAETSIVQYLREIAKLSYLQHLLVCFVLAVSIMQTIVKDINKGNRINAFIGVWLMLMLPSLPSTSTDKFYYIFMFPLDYRWIFVYTLWSIISSQFVLDVLSTFVPIIITYMLGNTSVWLGAMFASQMVNTCLDSNTIIINNYTYDILSLINVIVLGQMLDEQLTL